MMCTTTAAGKIVAANGLWRRSAAKEKEGDAGDFGNSLDYMSAETRELYKTQVVCRLQKKRPVADLGAKFVEHGGRDAAVLISEVGRASCRERGFSEV